MGVGFIQLLAVGSEKNIFNYNPNISFFKTYFRRHSNFFINNMTIQGNQVCLSNNNNLITSSIIFKIPKNGDLIGKSYIQFTFNDFNFELFSSNNVLISTLNTDLLSFYDNYYLKVNDYKNAEFKNISIIKVNYYYTETLLAEPLISVVSSVIDNSIISLIASTNDIELQTDITNIFYNIDLELNYFAYNVLNIKNIENIKNNNLFNYIYENINYQKLNYIQIDFKSFGISFRIIYQENNYYLLILKLLYSNDYFKFINQLKITNEYVYYSCILNIELYNSLLELFYINSDILELEIINNKINSTNIVIKENIVNKINSMIIKKNNTTYINLDIYNTSSSSILLKSVSSSKLTIMKNEIFFGNLTNEFYNDSLIKNSNEVLNLFNLNNSRISLNILIKAYVDLICYKNKVSIQEFLKIVNNKKNNTNLSLYYNDLNYFGEKLIKYFMNPNVLIVSNTCFDIILYTKNVFKFFNTNYFVQPFQNNKLTSYTSIIIDFYLHNNELLYFNNYFNNPNGDFYQLLSDLLFLLNYINGNKIDALLIKNIQTNYIYNNNLFEYIKVSNSLKSITMYLDKFKNPLGILPKNFLYLLITQSLNIINTICNKNSDFIYNPNGTLTSIFDNILNNNVLPLSSYLFLYISDSTRLCDTKSNTNDLFCFNQTMEEYILKLKKNLIVIINLYLYKTKTNIMYNINNIIYDLFEQLDFIKFIKNYYTKSKSFVEDIDFTVINKFLIQNQNINFGDVYPLLKKSSINLNNFMMLNLFNYTDKNLFNGSFENFTYYKIKSCNEARYKTDLQIELNYLKFIFTCSSPLYRIYFLFTFTVKLTIEFNINKRNIPVDIINLRDITFLFLITYFHFFDDLNLDNFIDESFSKYDMKKIYNQDYFLINNFLCFDEIKAFDNTNFLETIKNNNSSEYVIFYNNFYVLQKKIKLIQLTNLFDVNDIPNLCNDVKYNFDDKIIILFLEILNDNSQYFNKYNFVYDFVLDFFNKYNLDYKNTLTKLSNLEDNNGLIKNYLDEANDNYFYNCIYTTFSIGSLFDNINSNNIQTINDTFSLTTEYNNDGFNYNYSLLNFNIKKNMNYLNTDNIISCLKYFLTKLFEIFDTKSSINFQYYSNYLKTIIFYTNDNFLFFYLYLISEYNFNNCLVILEKYVNIFNQVNNSNINLFENSYTTKYNKTNFSKYNFIIIIYYYIYFIYNCLYSDIKIYNETLLVNLVKNFGNFINTKYSTNIYYNCINDLINVFIKNIGINNINIDFSTSYFTNNKYLKETTKNSFSIEKETNNYSCFEFNILENNNQIYNYNSKLSYNILSESSAIYLNSSFNSASNLIQINQKFNQLYSDQILNLIYKINKILIITNNIDYKSIQVYQNKSLTEIFLEIKNYYYVSSIDTIKKIYLELYRSYSSSIKSIITNSYTERICQYLLKNIKNFYERKDNNYFYTIYNFFYKTNYETNSSTNKIKTLLNNSNLINNESISDDLNIISNTILNINIYYNKFINTNISNSIIFEKEINRIIYFLCTNYLINDSFDIIGTKKEIYSKTLYDVVKLYNYQNLINGNQKNKIYLNNTSIYYNQSIFEILNFENMVNNISWTQNFWVNNIISEIEIEYEFSNSLFKKYHEFISYVNTFNINADKLVLDSGISVIEYFSYLENYDELCTLVFNYICLNDTYSPNCIFNNIVELNKSDNINTKLSIETEIIKKKIIVFMFFTWIILSSINVLLIQNIEVDKNLILEYNILGKLVDVELEKVLDNQVNMEIIKWSIYTIYNMELNEDNINGSLNNIPDFVKNYLDIIEIVKYAKKICSPIKYFNILCNIYISSYNSCIGYSDINTNNLYQHNEYIPSLTNLVSNFNVIINNDINPNNINTYDLTYYSLTILKIKFNSRIYSLDNIEFNKNLNVNKFSLNSKNIYTKSKINDYNLLLSLSCLLLNNYNITYNDLEKDLNSILINLRTGTNSLNELLEIFKGYFSDIEMSTNLISKKYDSYEYFISRIFNISKLSKMAYKLNNLSLITPNDYDNFISIINFKYQYPNFFQKYFSYNFNYNNFNNNYVVIYKNLFDYYKNIVNNTNAIYNIKKDKLNLYIWLFTDIFKSYISTIYYSGLASYEPDNYISIINVLINLYFKYNYSFRINNNISNYENLIIQNKYYTVPNLISWKEINNYLINYYYYQLFSIDTNPEISDYKYDIIYFFEILNVALNINFYYSLNYLNLVFKIEIILKYLIYKLSENYSINIKINEELFIKFTTKFIKYFSNVYTISNFCNQKYIESTNDLVNYELFNSIQNCTDKDTFFNKFSKSITNLVYWINEYSYEKNIFNTWDEYFKDYIYEYYSYTGNQFQIIKTNLTINNFILMVNNYINYCLLKKNGFKDFVTIEITSIYLDIFSYTRYDNKIFIVEPLVLELFLNDDNITEFNGHVQELKNISHLLDEINLSKLSNNIFKLFTNIFLFITNLKWGIIDFNEINNKPNIKIRSYITFLNYYFTYMNFLINREKYKNIIVYDYKYYFNIFSELYILYYLIIIVISLQYINYDTNYTLINNILTNSHKYIEFGIKIYTLNLRSNFAIYMDNLNSNIIKDNTIINFYKDIQNNTVYDSINYGVVNFNNNFTNYDDYITKIFNRQIDTFNISYENNISSNTFYNIIINTITNLSSNVKLYGFNSEIIIGDVHDSFIKNINLHIEILKTLYGGQDNNNITLTNSYINNLYNLNNYKKEEKQITIFTLIFKQINDGIIEDNVIIILFYYICFITWSTLGLDSKDILYDIQELFYELCNLINKQIINFVNFLKISNNFNVIDIYNTDDNFFNKLNILLFNNYNDFEFINATKIFFNDLILNNLQIIPNKLLKNLLDINQSMMTNTNNYNNLLDKFNIVLDKYEHNLFFGIKNVILNYKYLISLAIDYNSSFLIKNIKSINNVYRDVKIQKKLIDYIIELNEGLINEYGILKMINKLQLRFDDELISEYHNFNYKVFIDNFQNINKQKLLDEMMGLKNTDSSYIEQEYYITTGNKPYLKKFLKKNYILPVKLFFENYFNSIPLITCMYSRINLSVFMNNTNLFKNSYTITNLTNLTIDTSINYDFILVERDERLSLCSKQIDNLIERNNFYELVANVNKSIEEQSNIINLNFDFNLNNLVKEIVWTLEIFLGNYIVDVIQNIRINIGNITYTNEEFNSENFIIPGYDFILNTKYYLDGARRDGINKLDSNGTFKYNKITTLLNPYKYNTKVKTDKNYNTYSFALEPTKFQPSGCINMSNYNLFRIQIQINKLKLIEYLSKFEILFNLNNLDFKMNLTTYEYNLVRYQSGLAGLLFIT